MQRRRVVLLLLILGLTPLLAVALLTTAIGGGAITDQVNARVSGASRQAAAYVGQVLSARVAALDSVADDLPVLAVAEHTPGADMAAATLALQRSASTDETRSIVLTDTAGLTLIDIGDQDPIGDLPGDWRSRLDHGGSLAVIAPSSPSVPAVDIAVPILRGGGSAGGFLVARSGLKAAETSLETFAGAQGMTLLVVDREGRLVLGSSASGPGGAAQAVTSWTPQASVTAQVQRALSSQAQATDDAAGQATAYFPVAAVSWAVQASLPASALAPVATLQIAVISLCGALALLFIGAVNVVNRTLRRQESAEAELIMQTAAMEHAAMHDPLTGLPNRLLFNDRLQHGLSNARRSGRGMALFVLDIDGFKALNDSLGHAAGDSILRETAARLQLSVRASDTVARLGGDEFVIVAVNADRSDAELIQRKVEQRMEEPVMVEDGQVAVRLSIGVAVYPDEGSEPGPLLRRADTNMYREKRSHRGSI
ncbi:MAG TPA: sensor domain-containing diguanylate cyclase [Candidatus Binatia bacterium]|nr:sensor domain-containing diguanylate cyclase [Candidatus Binatia bacterium]